MEQWKPILVGVDSSPESARAALMGWTLAQRAGTACRLVHVIPDYTSEPFAVVLPANFSSMQDALLEEARRDVENALRQSLPGEALRDLTVRVGRPAQVLADLSGEAELMVAGGKHHGVLGRWLVGSTAQRLVGLSDAPVWVVTESAQAPRRVLVAVDLSEAAGPTLRGARRVAELFDGELRVMHAIEPLPPFVRTIGLPAEGMVAIDPQDWYREAEAAFDRIVAREADDARVERVVLRDRAEAAIRRQVEEWRPDLVVVGSHGKGRLERLLVGSVTHHLLNDLPAALLVVPVGVAAGAGARSRAAPAAR